MTTLLLLLLLAHILGDFVFQPDSWVADKKQKLYRSPYLYLHLLVHFAVLLILLRFNFTYWKAIALIIGSHLAIDLIKLMLEKRVNSKLLFLLDQLAHAAIILWAVYLYEPFKLSLNWLYAPKVLLLLLCVLSVTFVAAVIVKQLLNSWHFEEQAKEESLTNAGKYIGMLERLFVFGFIVLNQWQAIGFLIAAKSIFRFSDLSRAKDRKLTEYILVGTLLSFALAILVGLLYQYLVIFITK